MAFINITIVTSVGKLYERLKLPISAKKLAKTTKIPVFKNWKRLILTVKTVLNYVKVSFLSLKLLKIKNCKMMKLKMETKMESPME